MTMTSMTMTMTMTLTMTMTMTRKIRYKVGPLILIQNLWRIED